MATKPKPAAAESTTEDTIGKGAEPVVTDPRPPRDGPELPVVKPIPGSDYGNEPDTKKATKPVKFTCPSCGAHTEVEAETVKAQGPQTCNLCGVILTKD